MIIDHIHIYPHLHLVFGGTQAEPARTIPKSVRASTPELDLWSWCHRCALGRQFQLRFHLPLRPHRTTVDSQPNRSLHGPDPLTQVSYHDEPRHRSFYRCPTYTLRLATADAQD